MDPERWRKVEALCEAVRGDVAPPLSTSALRAADPGQVGADDHERVSEAFPMVANQRPHGAGR